MIHLPQQIELKIYLFDIIKEFGNNVEDVPAEHIIVDDIDMAFEQDDFGKIFNL